MTDYLYVGGFGAALFNAATVTLIAVIMLRICNHKFTSNTIGNLWLILGFSLFGKNPLNVLPIWFGGWLYSKFMKRDFDRTIVVTLVATSLGPVVSAPINLYIQGYFSTFAFSIFLSIFLGILIGFIFEPIASNLLKVHNGFTLYNSGLAAGIIAITLNAIYQSFGINILTIELYTYEYHNTIIVFVILISVFYILVGLYLNPNIRTTFISLIRLNKTKSGYYEIFGTISYINMGILGLALVSWTIIMGLFLPGNFLLHGPALGAILSAIGYGAIGKNAPSTISLFIGVIVASAFSPTFSLTDPGIITVMFFVLALCPVPTKFGFHWGVVAGFLHTHFATSLAVPTGGMNLYNNGLAAGFVVILLYPIMVGLRRKSNMSAKGML